MPQSSFLLEAIQTMTEKLGCRRTWVSSMKANWEKLQQMYSTSRVITGRD